MSLKSLSNSMQLQKLQNYKTRLRHSSQVVILSEAKDPRISFFSPSLLKVVLLQLPSSQQIETKRA
jgi:hypothetical protein